MRLIRARGSDLQRGQDLVENLMYRPAAYLGYLSLNFTSHHAPSLEHANHVAGKARWQFSEKKSPKLGKDGQFGRRKASHSFMV